MSKKNILWIILETVFLAVFNTVFFVAGGAHHPVSVWLSYAFITLSYLLVCATPFLVRKSTSNAIFGLSIYAISSGYFFVEFLIGLIFIFIRGESYKAALVIQIIIAGVYAVALLWNMIANEKTADAETAKEAEVEYIKSAASKVKLLMDKLEDQKANKEIEKLYDALHASPTKPDAAVKADERNIINRINDLEFAVSEGSANEAREIASDIISMVERRNAQLKEIQ